LGDRGGWTTQIKHLELFFPMMLSKKLYLKNCVQGDQKQSIIILFIHTLYTASKNGSANLRCWVKEVIRYIFGLLQFFWNFHCVRVIYEKLFGATNLQIMEGQSGTKSPVKPSLSDRIMFLSTFLESLLNFLSNHLKKHYKIWYSQVEKQCKNFNCQKHSLKWQSGTKSLVKLTWGEKMTVLSTFLEFSLNFLSNNLKKHYKIWYSQG